MESQVNVAKDLSRLMQASSLGQSGRSTSSTELSNTVQKFEAYFIQSMLKSMRSASLASGLLESDKSNFYRDWHDQHLADDLASKETFGISKLLQQQFGGEPDKPTVVASLTSHALFNRSPHAQAGNSINSNKTTLKQLVTKELSTNTTMQNPVVPSTPEKFVQHVYPHAQHTATKLNISADVLVAIAALETGWGVHTPKTSVNQESFNYFGVKAKNWNGPAVTNITMEFDGNEMIEVNDSFRAYASPAESFNDFANLLLSSPRYQDVLKSNNDAKAFVSELQKAGYATDPNYAKKITSILDGSILKDAIRSHKSSDRIANLEMINTH